MCSYITGSNHTGQTAGNGQWQNALDLLRLLQNDYQGARRQLEKISLHLAERENLVNQHLQHTYLSSLGYRTLCLAQSGNGASLNSMGNIVLGDVSRPAEVPRLTGIEVRCLGPFEVSSPVGRIERWPGTKARSVFQYLLVKPREPVVKDVLMDALWPDCTPQSAGNNLKAAVHSLRLTLSQLFEGENTTQPVVFRQGSYTLNPELSIWIDTDAFDKHWARGRQLEKEGKIAEAIIEFEKAEALYKGDYLEDEPYTEWTLLRRETLKDIYLIILSKLADYCLYRADFESCIHYSQKILAKDFCREDTFRRLMYCYARLGQKFRALRWYEICCKTVRTELNAEPDSETVDLYNRIIAGEELSLDVDTRIHNRGL